MSNQRGGFSEQALRGLEELEARSTPLEAYAAEPPTGRGAPRNGQRPHYWGHRERLRNRFLAGGANVLPEYEVLELILFNGIPRVDVKPLAKALLAAFGDLNGVIAAPEPRLMSIDGMTQKAVIQLRLCAEVAGRMGRSKVLEREVLSNWSAVIDYCRTVMAHGDIEQFRILFLDRKNTLIVDELQARGTVDHVPVYTREVVKRALELNASAVILVHNHPSGDPTPSDADIEMTDRIQIGLETVGIVLHDHIVIGKETEASFRTLGLI